MLGPQHKLLEQCHTCDTLSARLILHFPKFFILHNAKPFRNYEILPAVNWTPKLNVLLWAKCKILNSLFNSVKCSILIGFCIVQNMSRNGKFCNKFYYLENILFQHIKNSLQNFVIPHHFNVCKMLHFSWNKFLSNFCILPIWKPF